MKAIRKNALVLLLLVAPVAYADDSLKDAKPGATLRVADCIGWRPIAAGFFMLKQQGTARPVPRSELEAEIIDQIYSPNTSVADRNMAEAMGEQTCIYYVKRKNQG